MKTYYPRLRRITGILIALAAAAFFMCFIAARLIIRTQVTAISQQAVEAYPGDRVDALLAMVQSERFSLKERNQAVRALGQIGDERALPVLESLYTGEPCDHERALCQRELEKAIHFCRGGVNLFRERNVQSQE